MSINGVCLFFRQIKSIDDADNSNLFQLVAYLYRIFKQKEGMNFDLL